MAAAIAAKHAPWRRKKAGGGNAKSVMEQSSARSAALRAIKIQAGRMARAHTLLAEGRSPGMPCFKGRAAAEMRNELTIISSASNVSLGNALYTGKNIKVALNADTPERSN
ncbi:hypothetical protein [Hyphomicrobium sp. DY-1]|uniref:hypothetical protein n=1 Tax=Hyphomicrobium sp. DY-1 TaxID=3075650 RepID=UPI0039C46781